MDWSNVQNVSSAFGGLLLLIYFCWTVGNKVLADLNIVSKRQKEKHERKEKLRQEHYSQLVYDVTEKVLPRFADTVDEKFSVVEGKIDKITDSTNDLLRININNVYYKYNHYKRILRYDKENCAKMVQDYVSQGGNTYIHDLWEEMCTWEVVLTWAEVISE